MTPGRTHRGVPGPEKDGVLQNPARVERARPSSARTTAIPEANRNVASVAVRRIDDENGPPRAVRAAKIGRGAWVKNFRSRGTKRTHCHSAKAKGDLGGRSRLAHRRRTCC